jgi:subtilase family serine protease
MRLRPAVARSGVAAAVLAVLAVTVSGTALAVPSAAGTSASAGTVTVAQGSAAAPLTSGLPLGATPANTPVDVSIILRARNLQELKTRVSGGWTGSYLTTQQFAARYGQTPAVVSSIVAYLKHFGIHVNKTYGDNLDVTASGKASQFNAAFGINLQNFLVKTPPAVKSDRAKLSTVHGSKQDPRVPATIGNSILAILGLTNYSSAQSQTVPARAKRLNPLTSSDAGLPSGVGLGPSDFVNRYGLSALETRGSRGQGTTLGIITLAALDPSVPLQFWNKYLGLGEPASRLTLISIDGGAPGPSVEAGTAETDLDVEQAGAIAPKAKVRVYEAPNTDPGFADAYFAAASDNLSDTVSTSWGESETFLQDGIAGSTEPAAYEAAFDEAFLEMAAQGQSDFTASGDTGAYEAASDLGTTNISQGLSGTSPYITSAGGTTLPGSQTYPKLNMAGNPIGGTETVNIPGERAWSWDYQWVLFATLPEKSEAAAATDPLWLAGGGGGYSVLEPRPAYQQGVSAYNARQYLKPTKPAKTPGGLILPTSFAFNAFPPLLSGQQFNGRAVPDISTNADPATGYAVYDPDEFGDFATFGGTSFVAPQLDGSAAVIDSALGHRTGLWNPAIYAMARGANSPFTPLNDTTAYAGKKYLSQTSAKGVTTALPGEFSNNNLYYTGRPGSYWNPAVGLGTPNLTQLEVAFSKRP